MGSEKEFRFKINAYTPKTIPMLRLAQYMADIASLFGEPTMVHFVKLEEGSTVLVQRVDAEAVPKVEERIKRVPRGEGPPDALKAFKDINRKLKEDNGSAVLKQGNGKGEELLQFLGRDIEEPVTFGAFNQEGSLDGVVISVGGRREIVPIHLQVDDNLYICEAQRGVAKRIAAHIFTDQLRVHGTGRWHRSEEETWILDRFTVTDFEVLNDAPLSAVVEKLRAVEGSEWTKLKDPWSELRKIRSGPHGTN